MGYFPPPVRSSPIKICLISFSRSGIPPILWGIAFEEEGEISFNSNSIAFTGQSSFFINENENNNVILAFHSTMVFLYGNDVLVLVSLSKYCRFF